MIADRPVHPDPQWFQRLRPASGTGFPSDICHYCPHVRGLHGVAGCAAPASQFDPTPCSCTNKPGGKLFANPATLTKLTATGNAP